jgi:hypothetical protein
MASRRLCLCLSFGGLNEMRVKLPHEWVDCPTWWRNVFLSTATSRSLHDELAKYDCIIDFKTDVLTFSNDDSYLLFVLRWS